MSVRLRLQRHGARKRPFYRVVAADQRSPRDGRFIENLGTYDPLPEQPEIRLNRKRIEYWLSVGAQPSDTVRSLIRKMNRGEPIVDLSEEGADAAARAAKAAARRQAREEARKAAAKAAEASKKEEEEAAKAAEESGDEAADSQESGDESSEDAGESGDSQEKEG